MTKTNQSANQIPFEFRELVIDTLENLYDIPHLQNHALNSYLDDKLIVSEIPHVSNPLRKTILEYLELLSPRESSNIYSPQSRLYNVLYLRFVEGLTVQQTANELGISSRQAYRDLQKGKNDITRLFWDDIQKNKQKNNIEPPIKKTTINPEMANINISIQQIDLKKIINHSLKRVESLSQKREIKIEYDIPNFPIKINSDVAIAQQICTSIISQTIQSIQNCSLNIQLIKDSPHNMLNLSFKMETIPESLIDQTTKALCKELGWLIEEEVNEQNVSISIKTASQPTIVIVIDDNEGIIDLFKRYLTKHEFKVVGCLDGNTGIQKARTLKPILIFLDVMMPYVDGWEVLQNLQIDEETQHIPVIICSVFNDPALAFSLGAAGVISKPIRRDDITAVFHDLGIL